MAYFPVKIGFFVTQASCLQALVIHSAQGVYKPEACVTALKQFSQYKISVAKKQ